MLVWGRARVALTIALMAAAISSCKQAGAASGSTGANFPVRVASGSGDATVLTKVGTVKSGDGQRLSFDLQRDPPLGTSNIFACWELPAPSTPLGRAVCIDDASKGFEIAATNVDFLCRTNPEFGVMHATTEPDFTPCAQYDVFTYAFEPNGVLEVVVRK